MFNRLKDHAKITDQDPRFKARYVGNAETFTACGRGCTTSLVQRLWDNAEEEHFLPSVRLKITPFGIAMKHLDRKKHPVEEFPIENISFCNVDLEVNDKIFSWIYRPAGETMWRCHAVVCSSTEKARAMALVLTRAFHVAYKEWKSMEAKETRELEKIHRSKSLPAITLVKKGKSKTVTKQKSLPENVPEKNESVVSKNQTHSRKEFVTRMSCGDIDAKPGTSTDNTEFSNHLDEEAAIDVKL